MNGTEIENHADADEAAAAWFHRLAEAGPDRIFDVRRAFENWLAADEDHAEAFARTVAIWGEFGSHAAAPEMIALREAALADARKSGLARWRPSPRAVSRFPAMAAALLVCALAAGTLGYFYLQPKPAQTFATEIGERRTVTLADNSRVDIDADSSVSVDFSGDKRRVRVLKGQAFFQVEKDSERPFVVQTNDRSVVATGTQFDVEAVEHGVQVTLVEGRVLVGRTGTQDKVALAPNDQWTDIDGASPTLVRLPSTIAATAWRLGKLLFNDEPLGSAVARVERYSRVRLAADPSVASIRIGGAFDVGDVRAFLNALAAYYPVDVVPENSGYRLVRRSGARSYSH